ncbi:MAG: hypothetical protein IIW54_04810 [Lachnospiraceae bacterium]|nr:hypothetical protein [Lachnospiraceae bacterium]
MNAKITLKERILCQRVADIFNVIFEEECESSHVSDAGKYGFVYLQGYRDDSEGFVTLQLFTDSKMLFKELWDDIKNAVILKEFRKTGETDYR